MSDVAIAVSQEYAIYHNNMVLNLKRFKAFFHWSRVFPALSQNMFKIRY